MRKNSLKLTEKCGDTRFHRGKPATRKNIFERARALHGSLWRHGLLLASLTGFAAATASAQWQIVTPAPTTADLRGIDNVGGGVAWASGSNGAVLRTEDAGYLWQRCTIPPGADHLDFRGIQAFDANTAIVMSSGKGPLSRLYKTTDGCQTWTLVLTNPDPNGFFDAFRKDRDSEILLGDPVDSHFAIWRTNIVGRFGEAFGDRIERFKHTPRARKGEAAFAASNSSLFVDSVYWDFWIATGGTAGSRVIKRVNHDFDDFAFDTFPSSEVPVGDHTTSSGIFALTFRQEPHVATRETDYLTGVAVGGDYLNPGQAARTAAFTTNSGKTWTAATTPPHGYRSAVAYESASKTWITVGPNGTDISTDDGRNWRALRPDPKLGDAPDADQHWNALSLPYVVGPHGRIGILRRSAIESAKAGK